MDAVRWHYKHFITLQWHYNGQDSVSNHQPHDCLLNRLFRRRLKKTSKLRVTGLCAVPSEFPAQMASYVENVSIWWRHHDCRNIHHCGPPKQDKLEEIGPQNDLANSGDHLCQISKESMKNCYSIDTKHPLMPVITSAKYKIIYQELQSGGLWTDRLIDRRMVQPTKE